MTRHEEASRAVADRVLAHLTQCPYAADTAEGIREWWLAPLLGADLQAVEAALERLVNDGLIERAPSVGGGPVYRRVHREL